MKDISLENFIELFAEEHGKSGGSAAGAMERRLREFLEAVERRGHATPEEIGEVLPNAEEDIQLLDEIFSFLEEHGISVYEGDEELQEMMALEAEVPMREEEAESGPPDSMPVDDTIGLYLHEMGQEPLLSHEEEIALAQQIERGKKAKKRLATEDISAEEREALERQVQAAEEARARFIRANTQLVVSIAKRYQGQGVPFLDLVQEGNLGLMKAVEKFDYRRSTRFSTYATWWIRQAITRALPAQGRTIRIPIKMSNRIRHIYKVSHLLEQELGRRPSPREIAEKMDLNSNEVQFALRASRHPMSLETPVGEEEESELGDFIADELMTTPIEAVERKLLAEQVRQVLDTLTPREAQILILRFGLQDGQPHTLKEVGKMMGLTRERIRQIEKQALKRLRYPSRARLLRDFL